MILNDICEFIVDCPHSTAYDEGVGYPLIRTPNIGKGRLLLDNVHRVSEEIYMRRNKRATPQAQDIILAREAPAGNVAIIKEGEQVCLGQRTVLIRPDQSKVDPMYLTYYLLTPEQQYKLLGTANGSTVAHVNIPVIRGLPVTLPNRIIQNRIANILSAYDDLIENHQKQIKLLEEAAQRLYKEWFVDLHFPGYESVKVIDGVPEGWKKCSMDEIAEYTNGFAFKPSDWGNVGKPIIKIKELNDGITKDTPRNKGENIPSKYNISSGDIVFSWSATLMAKIWDSEDGLLNQHLFHVSPNKGIGREYILQSILRCLEEIKNLTTGSTMKHIQRDKLKQVFVNLPDRQIMIQYNKKAEVIREYILILNHQISLLIEARDRLLPKLMNGEMAV